MIGFLSGTLAAVTGDRAMVDVGGVGYEVHLHAGAMAGLPHLGSPVRFYTLLEFRNETLRLYGFTSSSERDWYVLLTSVPGVGGKGAQALLGTVGVRGLATAVAISEPLSLTGAPGVGKKLAERVVRELKDRVPTSTYEESESEDNTAARLRRDAISALVNLGYRPDQVVEVVHKAVQADPAADIAEIIRASLQRLGGPGG